MISIDQSEAEALYGNYSPGAIFSTLEAIDSEPINGITRAFKVQEDGLYIYYVGESQFLTLAIHASSPDQLADINMYHDLPIIADSVRATGSKPDEDYYGFTLDNAISIYQGRIKKALENRVDTGVTESTSGIRLTELAAIMPRGNAINYTGVGVDPNFTRVYTISDVLQRNDIAGWHETAATIRDAVDNGSLLGVSVKSWGSPTCNPARFEVSVWLFDNVKDAETFATSGDLEKAWKQD